MKVSIVLRSVVVSVAVANAFQVQHTRPSRRLTQLQETSVSIEEFLSQNYPAFMSVLSLNEQAIKALRDTTSGYTVFAPNAQAFEDLGQKKRDQLKDVRNAETAEKIGAYHVINEPVTAEELFASGGVITLGGEVPVGRSTSGGVFGFGGKEDGGVTVNGAKVVRSVHVGSDGIVHEVDALISPQILWRYCDQLRIPGSK